MYLPTFALMRRQHGLITHHQLVQVGTSPEDVRHLLKVGRLIRLRRGVYCDGEIWTQADPYRERPTLRARAASLTLRTDTYAFSHDSAAILLDMGCPAPTSALVHVSHAKVHGDAVRAGIKHHLAPYSKTRVLEIDGLRLLDPVRTALDLAREHGRAAGLAGCDAALRLGVPHEDFELELARMHCWPGSRVMRWCIENCDDGAESYLESQGRELVLELGIGRPETQFGLSDGRREVWCDIRVARHVFEVDGFLKYPEDPAEARAVLRKEKARQDFISGFKIGVSRITAHDCGPGREAALIRLSREFQDTCARFGTSIEDLRTFVLPRSRRRTA